MANDGDSDRDTDGLISSPVLVGDPCTEKRNTVHPEGVEGVDTIGSLGSLSKSSGDTLGRTTSCTGVVVRPRRSVWCWKRQRMVHKVRV